MLFSNSVRNLFISDDEMQHPLMENNINHLTNRPENDHPCITNTITLRKIMERKIIY